MLRAIVSYYIFFILNNYIYCYDSAGERLEEEERRKEKEQEMNPNNEDHVLKSLFEMTGIQSALHHDQIMDSASHDAVFVEREGNNCKTQYRIAKI